LVVFLSWGFDLGSLYNCGGDVGTNLLENVLNSGCFIGITEK
jgi:hypothetical protein